MGSENRKIPYIVNIFVTVHICCFKNIEKAGEGLSIPILLKIIQRGKIMRNFTQRIIVVFLFLFTLAGSPACTHKGLIDMPDSGMEVWELQINGETKAKYRMLLKRVRVEKDVWSINGEFSGIANDHIGGIGMVRCRFHGKIERNNLKVDFKGHGNMAVSLSLTGKLWGTLFDSKGSGEWRVSHEEGQSKGQWTMKRIIKGSNPS